ncbi:MAG: hypothetical protein AAGI14_05285 [Pseudomonadota bacterium]
MLSLFLGFMASAALSAAIALVLNSLKTGKSLESWPVVFLTFFGIVALSGLIANQGYDVQLVSFWDRQ